MTPEVAKALAEAGPWAVVIFIGALAAISFTRAILILWHEHLKADQDDRDQRNLAQELLKEALAGNRLNASATADMAEAWDARNRADAERHRRADNRTKP